jgi:hypothetical protein
MKRKITGVLAAITFIVGFLLLDNSVTGNVILDQGSSFNILSLVGLLFLFCSAILTIYTVKKK